MGLKKRSRKDGRREESSLTVNGVMKEGGQEASDEPPAGASMQQQNL